MTIKSGIIEAKKGLGGLIIHDNVQGVANMRSWLDQKNEFGKDLRVKNTSQKVKVKGPGGPTYSWTKKWWKKTPDKSFKTGKVTKFYIFVGWKSRVWHGRPRRRFEGVWGKRHHLDSPCPSSISGYRSVTNTYFCLFPVCLTGNKQK